MNTLQLKNSIIKEISQIDDVKYLQKIHDLINSFYQNSDEFPFLSNNKTNINNDKEDFTDYIKEWIKDM
ncbi:MAG: hypothetical protein ABFR32_00305 [Bacteroidota bacterium]